MVSVAAGFVVVANLVGLIPARDAAMAWRLCAE